MQRKVFWVTFLILSIGADIVFPLMWSLLLTIPIVILSWWVAYRSGWF